MKLTARARLSPWANISWTMSDEEAFDMGVDTEAVFLPDCMAPDGADPCKGYQQLRRDLEGLRASHEANLQYADRLEDQLDAADKRCAEALTALPQAVRAERARLEAPLRMLVAACNRLQAEAEEYDFPDGLGRGAMLDYWHEFDQALERASEILKGTQ